MRRRENTEGGREDGTAMRAKPLLQSQLLHLDSLYASTQRMQKSIQDGRVFAVVTNVFGAQNTGEFVGFRGKTERSCGKYEGIKKAKLGYSGELLY